MHVQNMEIKVKCSLFCVIFLFLFYCQYHHFSDISVHDVALDPKNKVAGKALSFIYSLNGTYQEWKFVCFDQIMHDL